MNWDRVATVVIGAIAVLTYCTADGAKSRAREVEKKLERVEKEAEGNYQRTLLFLSSHKLRMDKMETDSKVVKSSGGE